MFAMLCDGVSHFLGNISNHRTQRPPHIAVWDACEKQVFNWLME